ncbi:hypothetical protein [Nostoc sp.]|uniref:hypothetical protein n=1 Tax=Nostoc sp. TaxID=1180 RepID=UPI002FF765AF
MPIPDMLIAFGVFGETLNLNAQENSIKYKYFVIIAAILLSLGVLGGWVIGGQQELQQR